MAGTTDHYGLLKLGAGDSLSTQGYKFSLADRDTIDRLLYQGAIGHHHTGEAGSLTGPTLSPSLMLDTTAGNIPASTRVYYKYTYVDQFGNETAASPQAFIDTSSPIGSPLSPTLTPATVGGTLVTGNYYYVLSVYEDVNTQETLASNINWVTMPPSTSTGQITLTLPTLPSGADGFNVYRKKPGGFNYFYLDSIDMTGVTPPTTYLDTGQEEDCNRVRPLVNSSRSTNSIDISLPGATPTVPAGYTWKIYRTYIQGNYATSLLHHVVELDGPDIASSYTDSGSATTTGAPPTSTYSFGSPSKIDLATEVDGILGIEHIEGLEAGFPFVVTFAFPGTLDAQQGVAQWVCEFDFFEIVGCRIALGLGSEPQAQAVIVDVNKSTDGSSSTTIYSTQANRPKVNVGQTIGARTVPNVTSLVAGNTLSVDIDQDGGGASPTDSDLTINIYGLASF